MTSEAPKNSQNRDYSRDIRAWWDTLSWWRRCTARIGLQGRLVLCFALLLTTALGTASWTFVNQSRARLEDLLGEQAKQLASTLALASEDALISGRHDELIRRGRDLIKSRGILFVAVLDAASSPVAIASRDTGFGIEHFSSATADARRLMQVGTRASPAFGEYVEVMAPVLSSPLRAADGEASLDSQSRLAGYVVVGVSQSQEEQHLRQANLMVLGLGGLAILFTLPVSYLLVHRIFLPIRQLADASKRIVGGDLETRVAVYRLDLIGELARAFNEMVLWVRQQQGDLAAANSLLADANHDLEQKVQQRTAQLETANKRLATEIAEKEDFLRAISHDLNAPLRNIAGIAAMLMMKYGATLEPDIVHRLERIKSNVNVQTDLIAELLDLSRIKTRRLKIETVQMESLVEELRGIFDNDLKSRGIELTLDTPLPPLNCEKVRMRQVFQNLIDNAIKYMGDGPMRRIHIGCVVRPTEAEFYVRDTGVGIEASEIGSVFHVFRRGKNPLVRSVAGKGVGLASVKSIIETYQGSIWAESKSGQGTTFRFTINGRHVPLSSRYMPAPAARDSAAALEQQRVANPAECSGRAA